jgi:hypothetical protein
MLGNFVIMESGKEIGKQLQEIVWSFARRISPRIVVETEIKRKLKVGFISRQ